MGRRVLLAVVLLASGILACAKVQKASYCYLVADDGTTLTVQDSVLPDTTHICATVVTATVTTTSVGPEPRRAPRDSVLTDTSYTARLMLRARSELIR
jgi:hypothetical protein